MGAGGATRWALGALAALLAAGLACGLATPTPEPAPTPTTMAAPPATGRLAIAIEYAVPGLAAAYAATGASAAKPQPLFGVWGNIESEQGKRDWGPLDALVVEYQTAGLRELQLLITAESPWASRRPARLGDRGDSFPKDEYLDAYTAFVGALVERYDGDGLDDAAGLLYPVHQYGVERELTGYWPSGDAADYVRLLRLAYPAIKAADPQSEVLLVALLLLDVFDGAPDAAEVERRLAQPKLLSYDRATIETVLAACDAYDAVDFHSLGDYSEIPPTVDWLRAQLQANGCGDRPVWIGDAFSMSGLVGYTDPLGILPPRTAHPATAADGEAVVALLQAVADPADPQHAMASGWLWAEMARGLVKKIAVAAAAGLAGINVGNLEDWALPGAPAINKGLVRSAGSSVYMGMMATTLTAQQAGGPLHGFGDPGISRVRRPGDPRPAFYALQLAIDKLDAFQSVAPLELGAGVWAYRFERPAGPLWVLWYDDGALHRPGDRLPAVEVELAVGAGWARVTTTPLLAEPAGEQVLETAGGVLRLALDATPLFVEMGE